MTSTELKFIQRLIIFLVIAAMCPLAAFAYRVALSVAPGSVPSPDPIFTLVPGPVDAAFASPTPTTFVVVLPNGWAEHSVGDEGFAISIPTTWQRLPVKPEELAAALESMRQSNPEMAQVLGSNGVSLMQNGVKFWAFDLDPEGMKSNFATNVTVTRQILPNPVSFDTFVAVNLSQLNALASRTGEVVSERIAIGGLAAQRVRYRLSLDVGGSATMASITQYLVLNGRDAYVLTYATRGDLTEKYQRVFEQSAQSLRLFQQ